MQTRLITTLSLITFRFEILVLNHAINSWILHHRVFFFTVAGPGASVETIQSGTGLGGKTGGKQQATCGNKRTTFLARRMEI